MSFVITQIDKGIATLTLNAPDRLNAFSDPMCRELAEQARAVAADDSCRAVVLTGAGRAFSSGADLKGSMESDKTLKEHLLEEFLPSIRALRDMNKPVIAAVNGPAAGIGVAYVLSSDLVVMNASAYLMQPFVNVSLIPDGGLTWELVRAMGHRRAYEFIVSGDRMPADECRRYGLANRVVEGDEALTEARSWAMELLEKAPLALAYSKLALRRSSELAFAEAFAEEADLQAVCGSSADFLEGVAAFVEKRKPAFSGK